MKTDKEIKALIKAGIPGKYPAGNNLYFRISPELTTTWLVRYTVNRKRKEITIGRYPDLTLRKAALEADDIKTKSRSGIDPQLTKKKQGVEIYNVDELAKHWLSWKEKTIKTWYINKRIYNRDISPFIGSMSPEDVTPLDVKNLVEKAAVPGRLSVANQVLQFCKELFSYGVRLNIIQYNPASSFTHKDAGGVEKKRDRALPLNELKTVISTMKKNQQHFTRDNFLNVALLLSLCVRKNELIVAEFNEFNLKKAVWKLPDKRIEEMEKTTKKRPIDIPLEPEVIEWITELKYRSGGSNYLFPARRASKRFGHISPDTLNTAIQLLFEKKKFPKSVKHFTVHDLRRTARTLMSKNGVDAYVAESCLGHVIKGIEGTYNVDDFFDKRRSAQRVLLDVIAPIING